MPPSAPTVGRPAQGFSAARAQKWILAAALISALTYGFRLIIEPTVTTAPARGGKAATLAGAGSPPPPLSHWAVSYGAGFLMLSIVSLAAPEVAASIAMLMAAGTFLSHGTSIVADITGLQNTPVAANAAGTPAGTPTAVAPKSTAVASTPSNLIGNLPGGTYGVPNGHTP
jgi:hypothetical protein